MMEMAADSTTTKDWQLRTAMKLGASLKLMSRYGGCCKMTFSCIGSKI